MRNGGLLLAAAALPLLLLPGPSAGQIGQVPGQRPNVIVIVTDDQREGLEVMPSTNELFVEEGVDFPNAFVTTPLCCPARASIMTGRYVHNHGVLSNGENDWRDLDESDTIQAKLDSAGYRTALLGKFLNHWPTTRVPEHFDEWWLLPDVVGRTGYYGATWNVNGSLQKIDTYSTTYLRRNAVEFIESSESVDNDPFYMYIAVAAAHRSFVPEPRYEGAPVPRWEGNPAVFETNKRDKPAYVRHSDFSFKEGKRRRAAQFRTLMSVDDMVGAINNALEANGEQNTLAILVSDSGYLWGEHGLTNKQVPYEQSVKMPMMLRWPGHGPDDDERLVTNVDIAPTIYAAAGVSGATDGRNLLDRTWNRDRIHLEYFGDPNAPAIPRWASTWTPSGQYVEYYGQGASPSFIEYYDLFGDPWQLRNIKAAPNNTWATRLRADRSCSGSSCP